MLITIVLVFVDNELLKIIILSILHHVYYLVQLQLIKVLDRRATLSRLADFGFLLVVTYIPVVLLLAQNA